MLTIPSRQADPSPSSQASSHRIVASHGDGSGSTRTQTMTEVTMTHERRKVTRAEYPAPDVCWPIRRLLLLRFAERQRADVLHAAARLRQRDPEPPVVTEIAETPGVLWTAAQRELHATGRVIPEARRHRYTFAGSERGLRPERLCVYPNAKSEG